MESLTPEFKDRWTSGAMVGRPPLSFYTYLPALKSYKPRSITDAESLAGSRTRGLKHQRPKNCEASEHQEFP